jgi:hypothetical protein
MPRKVTSSKVPQNIVLYASQSTALNELAVKLGFSNLSQYMQARGVAHIARAEGIAVPEIPTELAKVRLDRASIRDIEGLAQVIASSPALLRALAPLVAGEIDAMTAPATDDPPPRESGMLPPPHRTPSVHYTGRAHGVHG